MGFMLLPAYWGTLGTWAGAGGDVAATAEPAIRYFGPLVAGAKTVSNFADKVHAAGQGLTVLSLAVGGLKLISDTINPEKSKGAVALDATEVAVTIVAIRSKNGYVVSGAILFDILDSYFSNYPEGCDTVCGINNNVNLMQSAPTLQSQSSVIPGYPGP